MTSPTPQSVITADDFGASTTANHAILDLIAQKKIDRVGVMIRGTFTPDDITTLKNSDVKIDIHLDIPLLHSIVKLYDNTLRRGVFFLFHFICGRISPQKITREWTDQITEFYNTFGTMPDGINSHEHTHLFPPYFRIACTLAQKNDITFIRCGTNGPLPRKNTVSLILAMLHTRNKSILRKFPSLTTTQYLTSLDWIAQKDLPNILHKNNTELLFHPERPEEYEIMLTTDRSDRP